MQEDSSDSNGEAGALTANELASNTTKRQVYLEFSEFSPTQIRKIEDIFNQYVIGDIPICNVNAHMGRPPFIIYINILCYNLCSMKIPTIVTTELPTIYYYFIKS